MTAVEIIRLATQTKYDNMINDTKEMLKKAQPDATDKQINLALKSILKSAEHSQLLQDKMQLQ